MLVREVCEDGWSACVLGKPMPCLCVYLRYAQSWADNAAGKQGQCKMKHSKSYKVDAAMWEPKPRRDGGAGENLATAYVACCVWISCLVAQFG